MVKNTVLFDIDFTLFDTFRFKENVSYLLLEKYRLDRPSVTRFDKRYLGTILSPKGINIKDYSMGFAAEFKLDADEIFDLIVETGSIYKNSLYPDTVSALSELSKTCILGIYSQGYPSFQKNKLVKSGIRRFFNDELIFVFSDKTAKDAIKALPPASVIVEDKPDVLEALPSSFFRVHICRDGDSVFNPSVRSLTELPRLLRRAF